LEKAKVETRWIEDPAPAYEAYERGVEAFSAAAPDERYYAKSRMVDRIVIENFKGIAHLDLTFASKSETAPWVMLLGENGRGKSAILQAVALTLLGDHQRGFQKVKTAAVLKNGAGTGRVQLWLTGRQDPIELTFSSGDNLFHSNEANPKTLLLAYGATRLPRSEASDLTWARVENLFDPFAPLIDPETWFLELPEERFDEAVRVAKELLGLDVDTSFERDAAAVHVIAPSYSLRLDQLSDGYRSMLALAADIMSVLFPLWTNMKAAEGLVLIDELETHLHPSWKLRIVTNLRTSFPRVQFIVTTHDPLCLRGLKSGEIVVLRRDLAGDIFAVTDLPDVEGMRVDQLLTSEHFDLSSTVDPGLEWRFRRYYELIAKRELTLKEEEERSELKERIDASTVLGLGARERIVLEAADEFVARERRTADAEARVELKKETRQRLAEIWGDVKRRGTI
jgi:predicted ATPase